MLLVAAGDQPVRSRLGCQDSRLEEPRQRVFTPYGWRRRVQRSRRSGRIPAEPYPPLKCLHCSPTQNNHSGPKAVNSGGLGAEPPIQKSGSSFSTAILPTDSATEPFINVDRLRGKCSGPQRPTPERTFSIRSASDTTWRKSVARNHGGSGSRTPSSVILFVVMR